MSFHAHKNNIGEALEFLQMQAQHDAIYEHALGVLLYIIENIEDYEDAFYVSSPFYAEFFECIQRGLDQENCFAILECLIIFCRERQLLQKAQNHEGALLAFYEQSDLWSDDDNTLLHKWYWYELPRIYA